MKKLFILFSCLLSFTLFLQNCTIQHNYNYDDVYYTKQTGTAVNEKINEVSHQTQYVNWNFNYYYSNFGYNICGYYYWRPHWTPYCYNVWDCYYWYNYSWWQYSMRYPIYINYNQNKTDYFYGPRQTYNQTNFNRERPRNYTRSPQKIEESRRQKPNKLTPTRQTNRNKPTIRSTTSTRSTQSSNVQQRRSSGDRLQVQPRQESRTQPRTQPRQQSRPESSRSNRQPNLQRQR